MALVLTRLAVHTPERSASGTRVTALLRRDKVLLVMCVSPSPGCYECVGLPSRPTVPQRRFPERVTHKPAV